MSRPPLLLVEDELDLRRMMAEPLKPYFDVVEADSVISAAEALEFIGELRLVVSDNCLRAPGRVETGVDLHRLIKPTLLARAGVMIVSTGGAYERQRDYYHDEGIVVLHKPFSVRNVLLPRLARLAGIEL